jgi:uncharacterized coiled-coil protein SlyX
VAVETRLKKLELRIVKPDLAVIEVTTGESEDDALAAWRLATGRTQAALTVFIQKFS